MIKIYVDGYCSGNPGPCGFRGVMAGKQIFRHDLGWGTNNIAEFVAVVRAIHYVFENNIKEAEVWSDSVTALAWVKKGESNSVMTHEALYRAEKRLRDIGVWSGRVTLKKWETRTMGEIPADFGFK